MAFLPLATYVHIFKLVSLIDAITIDVAHGVAVSMRFQNTSLVIRVRVSNGNRVQIGHAATRRRTGFPVEASEARQKETFGRNYRDERGRKSKHVCNSPDSLSLL